jgi:hypothetical protein
MEAAVKILLIGASGTLGQKVDSTLSDSSHQVVRIGRKGGDVLADFADPKGMAAIYEKLKPFDAVAIAAGDVAFGALAEITREQWQFSFNNKLLGQISAVQQALPYINDGGSYCARRIDAPVWELCAGGHSGFGGYCGTGLQEVHFGCADGADLQGGGEFALLGGVG